MDAMRGVAAIMVLVYHLSWLLFVPAARQGYLAVDLFFALSGFVLAATYQTRLETGMGIFAFLKVRIIRLYPIFLVGTLLGCAKGLGQIAFHDNLALSVKDLSISTALQLLMIPTPPAISYYLFPLNVPSWSLFLEVAINIVFAAILFRLSIVHRGAVWLAACIGLIVFCLANGSAENGPEWAGMGLGLTRVTLSFTVGTIVFMVLDKSSVEVRPILCILPIAATIALLAPTVADHYRSTYDLAFIIIVCPVLIYLCARWEMPMALRPASTLLGAISYPLYIIQLPVMAVLRFVSSKFLSTTLFVTLVIPILLALAYLVYRLDLAWRTRLRSGRPVGIALATA